MKKFTTLAVSLLIAFGVATSAGAAVIVDETPTGTFAGGWSNYAAGQNFLVQFTLASTTLIESVDIFTYTGYADVGTSTTVRFRTDAGNAPATANLYEFVANVSSNSYFDGISRVTNVQLNPFSLNAGTYWFGVSGTNDELSWDSYRTFNQNQRLLNGQSDRFTPGIGDLAYRINGNVPEPGSVALLGIAICGLLLARRMRSA